VEDSTAPESQVTTTGLATETKVLQNVDSSKCVDNCMVKHINDPSRPTYGIPFGTDCQEWADDTLSTCQAECGNGQ